MKYSNSIATIIIPFIICLSLIISELTIVGGDPSEEAYDEVLDDSEIVGSALDPHPDPNEENYKGMIYIGRHEEDGRRMGFDKNNGMCQSDL